ncbi:MAG TPA: PD-(D/E)XK nuclease family protein [Panacibacter sp.]|nr:PD-(D/E)XK nuclease family protein [Panacibacter sp.]
MLTEKALNDVIKEVGSIFLPLLDSQKTTGELFNIFSVLQMERKENRTHSAFIAALLNPLSLHNKRTKFLELFVQEAGINGHLDIGSTKLFLEYSVGPINIEEVTGGRIDILLKDKNGHIVCIENKIDATDQPQQLQRYYNYNTSKNRVIYLNLLGTLPDPVSTGQLQSGKDFTILSYKEHIIKWLVRCIAECTEQEVLKASLKQYKQLLQKITFTMSEHMQPLIDIIKKNLEVADFISKNISKAKDDIAEKIRIAVVERLTDQLVSEFKVEKGQAIYNDFAQIWVRPKKQGKNLYFGIESFNGKNNNNGNLFIGVFNDNKGIISTYSQIDGNSLLDGDNPYWINTKDFIISENEKVNFSNNELLSNIFIDKDYEDRIVNAIVEQTRVYLDQEYPALKKFIETSDNFDAKTN